MKVRYDKFIATVAGLLAVMMVTEAAHGATDAELMLLLMRGQNFRVTSRHSPKGTATKPGHNGMDFGNTGSGVASVFAPITGKVLKAVTGDTNDDCGRVCIWDEARNNTIILAHMVSRPKFKVGQLVNAGDLIGKASNAVGDGCTATGPHLHIEIRTGKNMSMASPYKDNTSSTIDPLKYPWDLTAPTIKITAPAQNAVFKRGSTYTISWNATDNASGVGSAAVDLMNASIQECKGAPSLGSLLPGTNSYVSSVKWTVPKTFKTGTYKIKVAVRDKMITWGCTTVTIKVQ